MDVAFTDSTVDLQGRSPGFATSLPAVEEACGVRFARLDQHHGAQVLEVDTEGNGGVTRMRITPQP